MPRHPALALFALCGLLARPAPAAPLALDDDCPEGQLRNEDTEGHCCWEGQAWSAIYHQCVGLAECPAGWLPSADGEDCEAAAAVECADGRVELDGGCCWPGQRWQGDRCVGAPACPPARVARGLDCVAPPTLPPAETLPRRPVAPDDAVLLEPQRYTRGSPLREPGRFRNERRQPVELTRPVLIKKTETTRREWRMHVAHDPSRFAACGLDCPVERVSWYEALTWLNRLSTAEGLPACYTLTDCRGDLGGGCPDDALRCPGTYTCAAVSFSGLDCPGYRLPTEAEFEAAARAGVDDATPAGPVVTAAANHAPTLDPIAWYAGNSGVAYPGAADCAGWPGRAQYAATCGPHPVATRAPDPHGRHDLLGNVAEWVWDGFAPYGRRLERDPVHAIGLERGVRGGSWADGPRMVRAALRARAEPTARAATVGFRWARTLRPDVPPERLRRPVDAAVDDPADAAIDATAPPDAGPPPPPRGVRLEIAPPHPRR